MDGQPCQSNDEAKRDACLEAYVKLYELGALTDFLLPGSASRKNKASTTNGSASNSHDGMVTHSFSHCHNTGDSAQLLFAYFR